MATHILVLEHDDAIRLLTVGHLDANGYRVTDAQDGIAAWKALDPHGADAVVADCAAPRMNGFEFCRRVREDLRFESMPIVMTCAKPVPSRWRPYCSAFVLKPVDTVRLLELLRDLLRAGKRA